MDVRSRDKDRAQQLAWLMVLGHLATVYNLAIFDERERDANPHIHIEEAD